MKKMKGQRNGETTKRGRRKERKKIQEGEGRGKGTEVGSRREGARVTYDRKTVVILMAQKTKGIEGRVTERAEGDKALDSIIRRGKIENMKIWMDIN